jgi:hypothetical protein
MMAKSIRVAIVEITDENRSALAEVAISMYVGEPCRICGKPITRDGGIIFAGYSVDNKARSAHKKCWHSNTPKSQWAYPIDSK